jgi:hypothetical protein
VGAAAATLTAAAIVSFAATLVGRRK